MTHGFGGWNSAPGCIDQHAPPSAGVWPPYEKCADFFTFGHGSTYGTFASGVSTSYWILTAIGFGVMVFFLIWWVVLEDQKLTAQAAHLLQAGIGATQAQTPPGEEV